MKVITDIEGLKEEMQHAIGGSHPMGTTIGRVYLAIDAYTITAPDLVRREDIPVMEGCDGNEIFLTICGVPEWDGKE